MPFLGLHLALLYFKKRKDYNVLNILEDSSDLSLPRNVFIMPTFESVSVYWAYTHYEKDVIFALQELLV